MKHADNSRGQRWSTHANGEPRVALHVGGSYSRLWILHQHPLNQVLGCEQGVGAGRQAHAKIGSSKHKLQARTHEHVCVVFLRSVFVGPSVKPLVNMGLKHVSHLPL